MNRRDLLTSMLGASATAAGLVILSGSTNAEALSLLSRAWSRAKGRPLVVLRIPDDDRYAAGTTIGMWMQHDDDAKALLGACEVVAATREQLALFAPSTPTGPAMMVVLRTDVVGAVPTLVQPKQKPVSERSWYEHEVPPEQLANERRITEALKAALPAEILTDAKAHRARNIARTQTEYIDSPPPGARWAIDSGCGFDLDGEEPRPRPCGMGHVPERSRRFLYFFEEARSR